VENFLTSFSRRTLLRGISWLLCHRIGSTPWWIFPTGNAYQKLQHVPGVYLSWRDGTWTQGHT